MQRDVTVNRQVNPAGTTDPSARHPLDPVFRPRTVAVIGPGEDGGAAAAIVRNLIASPFGGIVFPVAADRPSVMGVKAYPSMAAVPEPVDLAVIAIPAADVPAVITECVNAGARAAIVISSGFRETGPSGVELERSVRDRASRGGMPVIGPNCLGVMSPVTGLNATLARTVARPGNVAFLSQSGALCTAVLDWSLKMNVGFSHFVSLGSMVDVGWGALIDYLGDDPRTKSIVIYMESIGDARSFLSAAREVALVKPIIVIKAGRTQAAARAAASHTGALTGSDEVLEAAFRRSGVLRVTTIAELFYMAEVLGKQPRPRGPRLTIVSNAGGPGVLATDALIGNGGELTTLSAETVANLDALLPSQWGRANPIDLSDDADPERYARAVQAALDDANSDGVLVVLAPQAMTDPTRTAELLKQPIAAARKPVLASWMGGADVAAGEAILAQANVPTFPYPDTAARVFTLMWKYSYNIRGLYETPALSIGTEETSSREKVEAIVAGALHAGRTLLTEVESKQVLAAYGIPVTPTEVAPTEDAAARIAEAIGFPVVLKVHSETITHKAEVGGVRLNLCNEEAVRGAFRAIRQAVDKAGPGSFSGVTVQPMVLGQGCELIIGSTLDPQFGPVLLFGAGGHAVEMYRDRSLALPPLNSTLARRMMEQTRVYQALRTGRGNRDGVDLDALEAVMVRFSQLVAEQPRILEIDVNPLLVSAHAPVALDARVILHEPDVDDAHLPTLAIRPYPIQYVRPWKMRDGSDLTIRPIRAADEPLMVRFHETLSDRSVYFRYFHMLKLAQRVAHERLTRMCFIDYDREMAFVADHRDQATGDHAIFGVSRLTRRHGTNDAEFAVVVTDERQHRGLGTELLSRVIEFGRGEKMDRITADILSENRAMLRVCERLGFALDFAADPQVVRATLTLADGR
jgi:acetyltransferase